MNQFQQLVAHLKENCPIRNHRLVIRRVNMNDSGCTESSDSGQQITISIRKQDIVEKQMETVIHEWGHALEYDRWPDHGKRWGECYAESYQAWEVWHVS